MRNRFKILLIGLSVLLGGVEIWQRLEKFIVPEIQIFGFFAYAGLFALCIAGLFGAGFLNSGWLRWLIAIVFTLSSIIVDSYQWAVGDFMNYDAYITMLQSAGDMGDALAQQGRSIFLAFGKAGILFLGLGLRPTMPVGLPMRLLRFCAIPVVLVLTALLFFRGGEGGNGLPSSQVGTGFGLLYVYERLIDDTGPREKVTIKRTGALPASDIVLIIDESIAGAYLDINSLNGIYSGLAKPGATVPIHNFGLAASITHCSVGANLSLRYGGTRENYRDTAKTKPAIWAYAKAAGMETIYIDAQRTGGAYQNQMDDAERALIDSWDQFGDVSVLERDHAVADRLAEYLNDGKPQYILVNKIGAHFPVNDKFPESHALHAPMLKRGKYTEVADTADKDELDGRQSNWIRYRNSYRNTLMWNVGGFFDRLFAKSNIEDATIIYTSDHGQTFHERGEEGLATHCTPDPEIEEGVVPLVVIGGGQDGRQKWAGAAKANHDKLSNYRIFPTLLDLMGFEKQAVQSAYGSNLFNAQGDPFTFNVRYNARLGSDPVWKYIPLDEIARPPVSDFVKKREVRKK